MPCKPCGKKFRLNRGPCMYRSLKACKRAEKAYYAKQGKKGKQPKTQKKMEGNHYADMSTDTMDGLMELTEEELRKFLQEESDRALEKAAKEAVKDKEYIKELLELG